VPDFAQPAWLLLLLLVPVLMLLRLRAGVVEGRVKRLLGILLRCLALVALIVALAGPLKNSYSRHTDVVFVLDVSRSIDRETAAQALGFVNRALAAKDPAARMGLVVFGADAAVEVLLRRAAEPVREISADVKRGGTDIGRALEVAVGAFPSGEHRRVVLLSDGRENLGRARSAAAAARSIGVEIFTIPLEKAAVRDEVYVQNISAPPWVRVHEPFKVQITLHSKRSARAHLVIMRNGATIHDADLSLKPGVNVFPLVEQASRAGLYEYEAVVNSEQDGVVENNRYQTFVQVRGAPKVLHAVGEPGWERYVTAALVAQGLIVDEVPGTALPASMHKLVDYDLVILNNVSGFDLSLAKMELLEEYVRDAGGGLINLGGDKSYSAGGYYGTPVERLLPVTMDVKSAVKIPSLAVIILIDKSGSMSSQSQGEEKLSIAKIAASAAIEVLNPLDRVGVLAFDAGHEWSVPPTEVGDRHRIVEKLGRLGAGGGTDLFLALQEAHRVMGQQQAKMKHLIVLTDGLTNTGADFEGLSRRIAGDGITVSSVAFGADADRALLEKIAAWGRGRFYYTDDPQNIPRIFVSETMVVSRDLIVEEDTRPTLVYPSEMVEGFGPESFPPLGGYLRTFAKPAAQVILSAREQDPLLVSWRYGLGKSVAFTSDLAGRWGQQWVGWSEFARFVSQMARWTMRRSGTESLLPTFRWQGQRGEILVDVLDRDDRFINGLEMQAAVADPERNTSRFSLQQIAPGRYRGEFAVSGAGRYYVSLSGSAGEVRVGPKTFGLAVPYSSEYLGMGVDREHLRDLAAATGGRLLPLTSASLAAVTAANPQAVGHRWRIWWPLFVAALVLLMFEVAVRKVALPESWRLRWQRLRDRPRHTIEDEPEYEELRATIAKVREQHLEALRGRIHYRPDDPGVRARLYLASFKSSGR
jgi:Mg-chelatase subunit ChlD